MQEYSAFFGRLMGVEARVEVNEIPGASRGSVGDHTKRLSITGPCRVVRRHVLEDLRLRAESIVTRGNWSLGLANYHE